MSNVSQNHQHFTPMLYGIRKLDFIEEGGSPVKGTQFWIGFAFEENGTGQEVMKLFISDAKIAKGTAKIAPDLQLGAVECRFDHKRKLVYIANIPNMATPPPATSPPKS